MSHFSRPKPYFMKESKQPPVEKRFYEVTFLGTICLVYLNRENVWKLSRVERIKNIVRVLF